MLEASYVRAFVWSTNKLLFLYVIPNCLVAFATLKHIIADRCFVLHMCLTLMCCQVSSLHFSIWRSLERIVEPLYIML